MQCVATRRNQLIFCVIVGLLFSAQLPAQAETSRSIAPSTRTDRAISTTPKAPKTTPTVQNPKTATPNRLSPASVTRSGYCCIAGKVVSASKQDCSRKRGLFFTDQRSAVNSCMTETGFCCNKEGTVKNSTRGNCERSRGHFFLNQMQAQKSCAAVKGFCCDKGQVTANNKGNCSRVQGSFFTQAKTAESHCAKQKGYCCKDGKTSRTSKGECSRRKGKFTLHKQLADRICQQEKGYCCSNSKVLKVTRGICEQKKGNFFVKQNEAARTCSQAAAALHVKTPTPARPKPMPPSPAHPTDGIKVEKQSLSNNTRSQPGPTVTSFSEKVTAPIAGFAVPQSSPAVPPVDSGLGEQDDFSAKGSQGLQEKKTPFQGSDSFAPGGHQDPMGGTPFGSAPLENMPSKTDMQSSGGSGDRSEDYSKSGNVGGFNTGGTFGVDNSGGIAVGGKVGGYGTDSKEVGDALDDLGTDDNVPSDDTVDFNNELHDNENPEENAALDQALANTLGSPLAEDPPSSDKEGGEAGTGDAEEPNNTEEGSSETEAPPSESGTEAGAPTDGENTDDDSDDDTEGDSNTEPTTDEEAGGTEGYDNPDRDGYPSYTGNNPLAGTPLESAGEVSPSTGLTKNDLVTDPAQDSDSTGNVPETIPGSGVTRTSAAINPNPEQVERPTSEAQLNTKIIKKIDTLINPPLEENRAVE